MDVRQDIFAFVQKGKGKVITALRESHRIYGIIYHGSMFNTTEALIAITSAQTLVLASPRLKDLFARKNAAGCTVMSPQMFLSRRPEHDGPILWVHAYATNGNVASLVLTKKKEPSI